MYLAYASRSVFVVLIAGFTVAGDAVEDHLRQGYSALEQKETGKALEHAKKAVAADPKDARCYLLRGTVYEATRDHDKAIADFSECLKLDAKNAAAYDRRGSEQFILGHIKESLEDFDAFLKLRPKEAPGHWKRGISLYYAGRYAEGRKQFQDGERVFGDDVENAVWHFLCNAKLKGVEKAREETLKIGKDNRVPMMKVYDLFLGKCRPADVMTAAEAGEVPAAMRKSQLFYAHLYLGLYYDAQGDQQKALEHMNLAAGKYRAGYMGDVAHVHAEMLRKKAK